MSELHSDREVEAPKRTLSDSVVRAVSVLCGELRG